MKIRNFVMLIKASAASRKLSTGLYILFMAVSAILILLSVSIIFPLGSNIENKINNHVYNREISVSYSSNTDEEYIESDLSRIKSIEHVTDVYLSPADLDANELTGVLADTYCLSYLHSGYVPNITSGRSFDEDESNAALVPEIIKDFNSADNKFYEISGEDLIGKTLEFSYGTENICKVTVVGAYSTADPIFEKNEIIIPRNDLIKYNDDAAENVTSYESGISDDIYYLVSVDSYKNVDAVAEEMSEFCQVDSDLSINLDTGSYNVALILLFAILVVFVIMVITGLYMFLQNSVKNRTNELALYRSLGYKTKHLFTIIFTEYLFFGLLAIAVGTAVAAVLNCLLVNPYLDTLIGNTLMEMTVTVSPLEIVCIVLCFIILLCVVCRHAVKRSEKTDLTVLLRER